jgi:hypothetical protein
MQLETKKSRRNSTSMSLDATREVSQTSEASTEEAHKRNPERCTDPEISKMLLTTTPNSST